MDRPAGVSRRAVHGWHQSAAWTIGLAVLVIALIAIVRSVDIGALRDTVRAVVASPLRVTAVTGCFALAFVLRAFAWRRLLPTLPFGQALAAIHVGLGANHVLPFRMGEPLRVLSVVRRAGAPFDATTASTLALRSADILSLALIGMLVGPRLVVDIVGLWALPALGGLTAVLAGALVWMHRIVARSGPEVRMPGPPVLLTIAGAWLLEAILVWQTAEWVGFDLTAAEALVVTATAVVAQVVAIAPGGVGTYEAAAVAAYVALGFPAGPALAAAVTAHALKTAYSIVAGGIALFRPVPGLLGRLRLGSAPRREPSVPGDGPVVLFLPAHDEEATVATVVEATPVRVCGRPVHVLVVDDGSTDATAAEAERVGAHVVRLGGNRGLGAAVRAGLSEALALDAAAVAFCDADGEYAPGELEGLVGPVLAGEADYVVGSRFSGAPRTMRLHRRIGNVVLTRLLAFVARRPLTDGQSGYRAVSRQAAREAEVIHDYNYAQVLTLDLLAKGFRYREVPISYRFRRAGRSFIRPGLYVRHVLPAVHRELNGAPAGRPAPVRPLPLGAE